MARLVFHCKDGEGRQLYVISSEAEIDKLMESYDAYLLTLEKRGLQFIKARGSGKPKIKFDGQHCPQCGGPLWDNRERKANGSFNAKAPDFSCRNTECKWAIWPGQYEMEAT